MKYSIAIDGPAGSGKSTIAEIIAKKINFQYVNSGALYRTVALYLFENNIDYKNEKNIDDQIFNSIVIDWNPANILLNGIDITNKTRMLEISNIASEIAIFAKVRNYVNKIIKNISENHNIIIDGRDIGSVVLPNATIKIFLDASIKVRANRIYLMNQKLNIEKPLEEIENDILLRDERDYNRKIAPLIKCEDAILIDSSYLTVEEIVDKIEVLLKDRV